MKKAKFILPALAIVISTAFAFGNKSNKIDSRPDTSKIATTYFVFTGTATSQYTDSTKWSKHTIPPTVSCQGLAMACVVESGSVSSRTQLVNQIQSNSGEISGFATITERKN